MVSLSLSFVSGLTDSIGNVITFTYPTTPTNYSLVNVNNSNFLQGLTPLQVANLFTELDPIFSAWLGTNPLSPYALITNVWTTTGSQTGLTGTKSGSYNINTTGNVTASYGNFTGTLTTVNVTPTTTNTYSIGTSALRYLKGWFSGLDVNGNVNITGNLSATGMTIDNGNTNITGNLNVVGNFTGNNIYAYVYNFSDAGYTIIPSLSPARSNFTGFYNTDTPFTNGIKFWNDTQANGGNKLQVQVAGMYMIDAGFVLNIVNTGVWTFGVSNNTGGIATGRCFSRIEGDGKIKSTSINCMKRLKANDNLSIVYYDVVTPVQNATVYGVRLRVERIGD